MSSKMVGAKSIAERRSVMCRGSTPGALMMSGMWMSSFHTSKACLYMPCSPKASPWSALMITAVLFHHGCCSAQASNLPIQRSV